MKKKKIKQAKQTNKQYPLEDRKKEKKRTFDARIFHEDFQCSVKGN